MKRKLNQLYSVQKVNGTKEEKNLQNIFFQLEKSKGQEKLWDKIKCEDGTYKFDIDSILNEQAKFYEKLFKTEEWDEEKGGYFLSIVKETLDDREKTDYIRTNPLNILEYI